MKHNYVNNDGENITVEADDKYISGFAVEAGRLGFRPVHNVYDPGTRYHASNSGDYNIIRDDPKKAYKNAIALATMRLIQDKPIGFRFKVIHNKRLSKGLKPTYSSFQYELLEQYKFAPSNMTKTVRFCEWLDMVKDLGHGEFEIISHGVKLTDEQIKLANKRNANSPVQLVVAKG